MKASTKILWGLAWTAASAGTAQAQFEQYLPDSGTKEIGLSGSFNFEPVESQSIDARVGYFLNRNLELGVDGSYNRVSNGGTERTWALGGFGNWHFPTTSALLPYVGGFVGVTDSSSGKSRSSFGAQGCAKYFFNPNVAGFAELRWRNIEASSDQTGVFLGLSVFFK